MDFLGKESLQRIAEKSERLDAIRPSGSGNQRSNFGDNFSGQSDISMHDEPLDRRKFTVVYLSIVDEVELPIPKEDPNPAKRFRVEFKDILDKVRSGFESTPGLDDSRKKVGLEVFEKIYEQLDGFSFNSWLEIEYQCSHVLSKINIEMREKLKKHSVESVCDQIDNYVYDNIAKRIMTNDVTDRCCVPPILAEELEFDNDLDYIFEDLKHLEMINREEKIRY